MKTSPLCRLIPVGLTALIAAVSAYGQASNAAAQPPPEYSKGDLETEQRIMAADIKDANFYIDRGIKAVAANLPESAKVSVLRATSRLARVDEMMKGHPEHIERLAFSLFYIRENVRKELRANYDKLRDEFAGVEDAMYALRRDMLRKGLFGEELQGQVAVLDAATKLLPEIQKKDPALAQRLRALVEKINDALASGDTATADKLIQQLRGELSAAGYQQSIDEAKQKIKASGGEASQGGGAAQALAGGGSLSSAPGGVTVTGSNGQSAMVAGATPLGGGKMRLADGTEVDLNGSQVLPDGSIRLADGRVIKDGRISGGAVEAGAPGAKYVNADGSEIVIPADFDWKNGEANGVEKVYVGGKGARLVRETKVTFKPTPSPTSPNTFVVTRTNGEARSWAFEVAPVPGSEKKTSGSLSLTIALSDRNGGTNFTVSKWNITSPSGSPTLSGTSGSQVTATFTASATYSIEVEGATDWGSSFDIKATLPVGVN
jgi:hypothetical protein